MMRTEWLHIFVTVADTRSFSSAARRLGITQSAVSKVVNALEARVDARLVQRSTRAVALTPEGERFYAGALAALAAIDDAMTSARSGNAADGLVRVTAPLALAESRLIPLFASFAIKYPRVQIELRLSENALDLITDTLDLAIRVGTLSDSALVVRRIGTARRMLVAAPSYLERRGVPTTIAALADHDCLPYALLGDGPVWRFTSGARIAIQGPLVADSALALRAAARAGMGIVASADWLFDEDLATGSLVRVLPDCDLVSMPIQAVLPAGRQIAARTRTLMEYLAEGLARDPFCRV